MKLKKLGNHPLVSVLARFSLLSGIGLLAAAVLDVVFFVQAHPDALAFALSTATLPLLPLIMEYVYSDWSASILVILAVLALALGLLLRAAGKIGSEDAPSSP